MTAGILIRLRDLCEATNYEKACLPRVKLIWHVDFYVDSFWCEPDCCFYRLWPLPCSSATELIEVANPKQEMGMMTILLVQNHWSGWMAPWVACKDGRTLRTFRRETHKCLSVTQLMSNPCPLASITPFWGACFNFFSMFVAARSDTMQSNLKLNGTPGTTACETRFRPQKTWYRNDWGPAKWPLNLIH